MNQNELVTRVRRVVSEIFHLPVEMVTHQLSAEMVESWDSLGLLNLVLSLEQEFGMHFSPEETERLISVGAIIDLLESRFEAGGGLRGRS